MMKIGLTGNIASGKSEVEKFFIEHNIPVIDADIIGHELLELDVKVIEKVRKIFFNHDILNENGEISRQKLSDIIFYDENLKLKLENILHPIIKEKIQQFFENNKNQKFAIASAALLFESKMQKMFDKIILVKADEKIRLSRLIERNKLSIKKAQTILNSQINEDLKSTQSDYIIENCASLKELHSACFALFTKLSEGV